MGWIKDLFVKQKTLEEVRTWVSESKDSALDSVRSVLERFDCFLVERTEKQKALDSLNSAKQKLTAEHSALSHEKIDFISSPEYRSLKESINLAVSQRKKIEAEIAEFFEPLKELIGQYAQSKGLAKLNAYSQNYLDAFIHDYDLTIIKHVPDIIQAVVNNQIFVQDATKVLGYVNNLKRDPLSRLIHSYAAACKNEERIKFSISSNLLVKKHEGFIKALAGIQEKIDELDLQIKAVVIPSDAELRAELSRLLLPHRIVLVESNNSRQSLPA